MELIQSKDNLLIKQIKKLQEKRHRISNKQFLVEGFRFVEEALHSDFEVPYVFINEQDYSKWEETYESEDRNKETKFFLLKEQVFKTLALTENPQGVIAVVKNKEIEPVSEKGLYILVDKIQDPGNMGTIIRTAHAAGVLGILFTKGTVDIYNDKTLRSSMGSIFHIPVIEDEDLIKTKNLRSKGFNVIVSALDAKDDFFSVDLTNKCIICIGNEGNGISNEVIELADKKVRIPMPGGAESLNAAVAASIMIFESVRQKLLK